MKLQEILNIETGRNWSNIKKLKNFNFGKNEFNSLSLTNEASYVEKEQRILVKEHFKDSDGDRRGIWIYSLYFDKELVLITALTGRWAEEYNLNYIINYDKYLEIINYLFISNEIDVEVWENNEISLEINQRELDILYGKNIYEEMYKPNYKLKFQLGAEVILKDDLLLEYLNVNSAKVKIVNVCNSKYQTYDLLLSDYHIVYDINLNPVKIQHKNIPLNKTENIFEDDHKHFTLDYSEETKLSPII